MNPLMWAQLAMAAVTIFQTLQKNQPVSDMPLTPEEQAAVDAANEAMNEAIAAWDVSGQTSDTPPETPEP